MLAIAFSLKGVMNLHFRITIINSWYQDQWQTVFFFVFFVILVVFLSKIEAYFYYRFFTFLILLVHLYKLSLVIFRCSQVSLLFQRQMLHFHFHMVVTINQTTSTEVTASLINPFVPNPPFLYGMLDTDL